MRKINLTQFNNLRLSIGCADKNEGVGYDLSKGWIGLDIRDMGQEIVWDLQHGIPLPDNSCMIILASQILEHFDAEEIMDVMDECWRVLQLSGVLDIRVPYISSVTAYLPFHKQQFSKDYFAFFTSPNMEHYGHKRWELSHHEIVERGNKQDLKIKMQPYGKN